MPDHITRTSRVSWLNQDWPCATLHLQIFVFCECVKRRLSRIISPQKRANAALSFLQSQMPLFRIRTQNPIWRNPEALFFSGRISSIIFFPSQGPLWEKTFSKNSKSSPAGTETPLPMSHPWTRSSVTIWESWYLPGTAHYWKRAAALTRAERTDLDNMHGLILWSSISFRDGSQGAIAFSRSPSRWKNCHKNWGRFWTGNRIRYAVISANVLCWTI